MGGGQRMGEGQRMGSFSYLHRVAHTSLQSSSACTVRNGSGSADPTLDLFRCSMNMIQARSALSPTGAGSIRTPAIISVQILMTAFRCRRSFGTS
jgi:hypothetical protein